MKASTKKQNPPKGGTLTKEQIEWLNECTEGTTWKLNPRTGLVDVEGGFDCSEQDLSDFKGVRFGVVGVDFRCQRNRLTSLEGAPREVEGDFSCSDNRLTSLVGAPQKVGGYFYCYNNLLTSLEGAPREVEWLFICDGNPVPERTLESIFSFMQKGASYEEVLRRKWKRYSHKLKSLLYRAEYQWIPQEEHKMFSALNKVNSVLKWI
jgi:hypothetical protein